MGVQMTAGTTRAKTIIGHVGGGGKVHSFLGGAEQQETQLGWPSALKEGGMEQRRELGHGVSWR